MPRHARAPKLKTKETEANRQLFIEPRKEPDSPLPAQKQAASIRIPAVISDVRNVSENTSFHQRNNTKSVEQVSTCLREFWLQVSVQPLQQGQGQAKQPLPSRCP